ncbi:Protein kinase [Friedmanniomyces endolithicus]|nr:Protein kinase [Friedmanniomyces endolithicus]KAK0926031.1 Protein kinase [Friedmanniomyces endolithicus]KAK0971252.1 Protein kinase [Friedmanniomyces endolithicus]
MDSYQGARGASGTPSSAFPRVQSAERFAAPKRADTTPPQRTQSDEEERRRKQEEQRRKADIDRRRAEKEQERRRRQGQEDRQYNENTPKQRTPIAKQEMGGYGGEPRDVSPSPSNGRYNAQRPAPPAPTGSNNGQSGSAIPIRNLQASRPAPAPPGQNGTKASPPKQPATNGSSYGARRSSTDRRNHKIDRQQPLTRKPSGSQHSKTQPATQQVKPLNVQTKQPTGAPTKDAAIKQAELALTKKDPNEKPAKVRRVCDDTTVTDARVRWIASRCAFAWVGDIACLRMAGRMMLGI